ENLNSFSNIIEFDNDVVLVSLGNIIEDVSEEILWEIELEVFHSNKKILGGKKMLREKKLDRSKRREKVEIEYQKGKDGMLYPKLQVSKDLQTDKPLGKYGRMAMKYLKRKYIVRL